ncbi:hypothetical protein TD95_001785 [Thielaviopsis punctulata]|uniref:Peptidase A1 domain-containing protein n=1 Tax=Thielaviopsis punctulata TaxID=72032 RepID=A0A0F4ZLI1_9PEZI|nr:hypothetical protein TD95_001785 [Thielaviopsis punctulata]
MPVGREDSYRYVNVGVGTPSVPHRLLFDTGSSTSWIISSKCTQSNCPNYTASKRPFATYNASASSTSHELGPYSSISYLGGGIAGVSYEDKWEIDNSSWSQTFLDTNQSSWGQAPVDGFLGLAFSTIAEPNVTTVTETLMRAGMLDEPRVGIYYANSLNQTLDVGDAGLLTLGGSHEDKYSTGLQPPIPVQYSQGQYEVWRASLLAITTIRKNTDSRNTTVPGGQNVGTDFTSSKRVTTINNLVPSGAYTVFDTGAESLGVPGSQLDALYDTIGMNYTKILNGEYIPMCSEFTDDWAVTFSYGLSMETATNITITGDMLIVPGFANREDACWPPFDNSGTNEYFFLFGTRWLRNFYTVLDFGSNNASTYNPTISFGYLKDEYKTDFSKGY